MRHRSVQVPPVLEPLRHIAALDGVRGLAVMLVLVYHLFWSNVDSPSRFMHLVLQLRGSGWIGVDIFFVLSGFLITGILFDTLTDPHFFRNFYLRRILRIFPLFYLVVLVLAIAIHPADRPQQNQLLALFAYLQNTSLYWRSEGTRVLAYSGHLWSLAVEEQFYFVWPLLVFFIRSRRALLWVTAFLFAATAMLRVLLLAHGFGLGSIYHLAFTRADSLLAGAWLALAVRGPLRSRVLSFAPYSLGLSLLGCIGLAAWTGNFAWQSNRAIALYGYSLLAMLGASLIACSLDPASAPARMMGLSFFRFFGRYSYGIYVYHLILFPLILEAIRPWLAAHVESRMLLHLALFTLTIAATVALAVFSFHVFEVRFLGLKRWFNYRAPGVAR
ncbi:acyltransferase family protein [Granulicella rosea]|nr:acyltransferase [Granulicella rosea]